MKQTRCWMLVAMFCICGVMSFLSCSKDNDVQGTELSILDITVSEKDWVYDSIYIDYSVWVDIPAITEDVFKYGNVQVSLKETLNEKECYFALPATYTLVVEDEERCYNEMIDFDWTIGGINLFLTTDDYIYEPEPAEMVFRVYITSKLK